MPWAELTDVRCHYQWLGEGEPVLLIAGLGGISRSWEPVAPGLAEHFGVLVPEPRGLGASQALRRPTHLDHYSADLIELLDHLQLERVHVVGISWGGAVAQQLATHHPTRVGRLVLISTTHRFSPYLREITRLVGQTMRRDSWRDCLRAFEVISTSPVNLDREPDGIDRRVQQKVGYNVARHAVAQQLRCLASCDTPDAITDVRAPTLVVAGEFDVLIPHCYSRQTAHAIPGSRFVLLEGAGHNLVAECPERLLAVMVPFLQNAPPESPPALAIVGDDDVKGWPAW